MGWPGKVLEQGPQKIEQKIEETVTGEENNWDLDANSPEFKSWPGLHPCRRAPPAALSPTREATDSRPLSTPPRSPGHMLHCPQHDHKPHMSCVPFILA